MNEFKKHLHIFDIQKEPGNWKSIIQTKKIIWNKENPNITCSHSDTGYR